MYVLAFYLNSTNSRSISINSHQYPLLKSPGINRYWVSTQALIQSFRCCPRAEKLMKLISYCEPAQFIRKIWECPILQSIDYQKHLHAVDVHMCLKIMCYDYNIKYLNKSKIVHHKNTSHRTRDRVNTYAHLADIFFHLHGKSSSSSVSR